MKHIILLLWILCELVALAFAAPVKFAWDAPAVPVTITHLREKLPDGSTVFLVDSTTQAATVDLTPGSHVIVATCMKDGLWSAFSDPVTVVVPEPPVIVQPPAKPTGLRVIEIQTSSNMRDWSTNGYYVVTAPASGIYPDSQFFRMIATTAPKP